MVGPPVAVGRRQTTLDAAAMSVETIADGMLATDRALARREDIEWLARLAARSRACHDQGRLRNPPDSRLDRGNQGIHRRPLLADAVGQQQVPIETVEALLDKSAGRLP